MSGPWPGRLALVALLWLLGGRVGLLAGLALVVYDAVRSPSPRELLVGSVVLLAAVPLAVLVRGLPTRATLGPDVAAGNLVAHVLAGLGLALLVLGVLRDVRVGRPAAPDPAGERALVLRRPDPPNGDRTP
ncbi:MAG TPA: hypothetical protein VI751_10045 [Actinomycetota bacterium]|jgi:hypothetical protein